MNNEWFTEEETKEAIRLKSYFPFRIVYMARLKDGKFECGAVTTKRVPNRLAKEGNVVVLLRHAAA